MSLEKRTFLVAAAWITIVMSVAMPGARELDAPMWAVLWFAVISVPVFQAPLTPFHLVLLGPLFFFIASKVAFRRPESELGKAIWWVAIPGLMIVWAVPPLTGIYAGIGVIGGFREFKWGYYVFCLAHTLMMVACISAPTASTDIGRRGFPVVERNEEADL